MGIDMVLKLLSGVALFLFGMSQMGDGLKRVAGNKLELILYQLTSTPFKGLILGTIVTAIIQSSSATTVMVVGFVNSGMMKVAQAIGIIMGSNIGTSVTGWVLSLSYIEGSSGVAQLLSTATISAVVAIVGIIFKMFMKNKTLNNVGDIMLGFAVLMFGMQSMSSAVSPLRTNQTFISLLTKFENPILGILAGILFTAVLQSASAAVGILQAISMTGSLTFASAFPIIMGIGVGAACPVLLSAIGTNKNGKRTAIVYLLNDSIGVIVWSIVFYSINAVVHFGILGMTMSPVRIAIVNSIYRVINISVLIWFVKPIEKFVFWLVKDNPQDMEDEADFDLLEERFLKYPALAIAQSQLAINGMAKKARKNVKRACSLLGEYSETKYARVEEKEDVIDKYEDKVGTYLMQVNANAKQMSDADAQQVSKLLHTLSDFERLGDHAMNIAKSAKELYEKKISFSDDAWYELKVLEDAIKEILDNCMKSFIDEDLEAARKVEPLREYIGILCDVLKQNHIARLQAGICGFELGFVFNDLITNDERIAAHCSNVALAVMELSTDKFDSHEYNRNIRERKDEFYIQCYNEYEKKFSIKGYVPATKSEEDLEIDAES